MTSQPTRALLGMLAVLAILTNCHSTRPDNRPRYATRVGDSVTLHPIPVRFRIPREWLLWELQFHNNVHLSRTELSAAEHGEGEWDVEYAAVVNAALPFKDCAAHIGAERWGKEGVTFRDTQLRAYITDLSSAEVLARFSGPAMDTARKVAYSPPKKDELAALINPEFTDEGVQGGWHRAEIIYRLWYYHYGGVARIRLYVMPVQKHTLVLVFMGGTEADVKQVLDSVTLNSK